MILDLLFCTNGGLRDDQHDLLRQRVAAFRPGLLARITVCRSLVPDDVTGALGEKLCGDDTLVVVVLDFEGWRGDISGWMTSEGFAFQKLASLSLEWPEVAFLLYRLDLPRDLVEFEAASGLRDALWIGGDDDDFSSLLTTLRRVVDRAPALFDPVGARASLKLLLLRSAPRTPYVATIKGQNASRRRWCVIAVDDESPFSDLLAYAALKGGMRAHAVSDRLGVDEALRACGAVDFRPVKPRIAEAASAAGGDAETRLVFASSLVIFADWVIPGFDDDDAAGTGALLKMGRFSCEQVVLVTGYSDRAEQQRLLNWGRVKGYRCAKPLAGIYAVLGPRVRSQEGEVRNRLGEVYESMWQSATDRSGVTSLTHGVPESRLRTAQRLLRRAEGMISTSGSGTRYWLTVAVLASDARDLLSGQSRTLTLQAIALMHEAEVRAEISTMGVDARLNAGPRLADIAREVAVIVHDTSNSRDSSVFDVELNSRIHVAERLRRAYADASHFEAADACLVERARCEAAAGHTTLLQGYFDIATLSGTSVWRLASWSALWVLAATLLLTATYIGARPHEAEAVKLADVLAIVEDCAATFLMQPDVTAFATEPFWADTRKLLAVRIARLFLLLIGVIHFGLFLSIIYRRLTRRAA